MFLLIIEFPLVARAGCCLLFVVVAACYSLLLSVVVHCYYALFFIVVAPCCSLLLLFIPCCSLLLLVLLVIPCCCSCVAFVFVRGQHWLKKVKTSLLVGVSVNFHALHRTSCAAKEERRDQQPAAASRRQALVFSQIPRKMLLNDFSASWLNHEKNENTIHTIQLLFAL